MSPPSCGPGAHITSTGALTAVTACSARRRRLVLQPSAAAARCSSCLRCAPVFPHRLRPHAMVTAQAASLKSAGQRRPPALRFLHTPSLRFLHAQSWASSTPDPSGLACGLPPSGLPPCGLPPCGLPPCGLPLSRRHGARAC